jgi:Tol biopolymer transport system component
MLEFRASLGHLLVVGSVSLLLGGCGAPNGGQPDGTLETSSGFPSEESEPTTTIVPPQTVIPTRKLDNTSTPDCGDTGFADGLALAISDGTGILVVSGLGSEISRITEVQEDGPPAWSPDGVSLAYDTLISYQTGNTDLSVIGHDGGTPRRLLSTPDSELYPIWSPNGDRIVYETVFLVPATGKYAAGVRYLDLATGLVHQVPAAGAHNRKPVWSPDGRRIAFLSSQSAAGLSGSNLNVFDIDTGTVTPLTTDSSVDDASWPKWSPDGQSLLVAVGPSAQWESDLALIDAQTGLGRLLTADGDGHGQPDWSPDGTMIALATVHDGRGAIEIIQLETERKQPLVDDSSVHADFPHWSPDGKLVAFLFRSFDSSKSGNERYGREQRLGLATIDGCTTLLTDRTVSGAVSMAPTQVWRPFTEQ